MRGRAWGVRCYVLVALACLLLSVSSRRLDPFDEYALQWNPYQPDSPESGLYPLLAPLGADLVIMVGRGGTTWALRSSGGWWAPYPKRGLPALVEQEENWGTKDANMSLAAVDSQHVVLRNALYPDRCVLLACLHRTGLHRTVRAETPALLCNDEHRITTHDASLLRT